MSVVTIGNPASNPVNMLPVAVQATSIPANTVANTVIKNAAGTFYGILVTSVGAGTPQVFDNASTNAGTIIGALVASAPIGPVMGPTMGVKCNNGITVSGGATNPAMTIFWT